MVSEINFSYLRHNQSIPKAYQMFGPFEIVYSRIDRPLNTGFLDRYGIWDEYSMYFEGTAESDFLTQRLDESQFCSCTLTCLRLTVHQIHMCLDGLSSSSLLKVYYEISVWVKE